jgi:16S rRNA (guanine527-N7)-methyltransferase
MEASLAELQAAAARWGVALSPPQLEQIRRYVKDLLCYNEKTNLTAETDPRLLILRHVADAVAAVPVLRRMSGATARILDIGAGGGFIGMGIKIAWPEADVTLMEAVERKYRFLSGTVLRSGLKGLHVLLRKAGTGPPLGREYTAATARAVAPLPEVVKLAAPLLRPGGVLLDYQSQAPDPRLPALHKALAAAGGRLVESLPYRLPCETKERYLTLFEFERGG